MSRAFLTIVALAALAPIGAAQVRPHVSLVLPSGMASETVQIDYFLSGPFGGYGSFVSPEKDIASYEIDPFVQGQATENVKIIAYLPGCEIATFDFKLSGAAVERNLDCRPLGSVLLRGQVLPFSADGKQNQEIEVSYLALWASAFSGNLDGPVTTFRLGAVHPDPDGKFEIMLPDLYKQNGMGEGAFEFILRDGKTGNIIAFLRPADGTLNSPGWLGVRASYPFVQLLAHGK